MLVGALATTFMVFAAAAMRAALRAREVQVPDLVGASLNDASRSLADLGLVLRPDPDMRADERIPQGRIMQQDPPAGVQARRQRTVRVWVSLGSRSTTVPPLVGQTERTARARLDQDGLVVAAVSEFRSPDYPAEAVVAQDPAPSAQASSVSVLLNRGEQATTFVMPDVIGMHGGRAADAHRTKGFRVAIVGSRPYPGVPAGTVVRQQPAGGFRVGPGDPISIEVSR